MEDFTHLPEDIRHAITEYEEKIERGEISFSGDFADMPSDKVGGWVQSHLAQHLSMFDL